MSNSTDSKVVIYSKENDIKFIEKNFTLSRIVSLHYNDIIGDEFIEAIYTHLDTKTIKDIIKYCKIESWLKEAIEYHLKYHSIKEQ